MVERCETFAQGQAVMPDLVSLRSLNAAQVDELAAERSQDHPADGNPGEGDAHGLGALLRVAQRGAAGEVEPLGTRHLEGLALARAELDDLARRAITGKVRSRDSVDLVLPSLDGESLSVASFRGKKLILHVFASW